MAAGLKKTCVCAWCEPNNPEVMACHKRFPDLVVPFGYINLYKPDPDDVDRRRDEGFVGLKFITTPVPYSDKGLMPIYERAAKYNMPAVFHTGWVAGDGTDPQPEHAPRRNSSRSPGPSRISRSSPLHLGNWWAEDAVGIMQHHDNVYFDLSGGFIRKLAPSKLRSLFLRQPDKNLRTLDEVVDYEPVQEDRLRHRQPAARGAARVLRQPDELAGSADRHPGHGLLRQHGSHPGHDRPAGVVIGIIAGNTGAASCEGAHEGPSGALLPGESRRPCALHTTLVSGPDRP